jgi:hypothetical protein
MLQGDAHAVVLLDCWSVHKSAEFLGWMRENHPNLHLVFIPGAQRVCFSLLMLHSIGLLSTMLRLFV